MLIRIAVCPPLSASRQRKSPKPSFWDAILKAVKWQDIRPSVPLNKKGSMHPFDIAIALEPTDEGTFRGRTSPAYANMVGPFGGATAATLLQAALQHEARIGEPIALTVNFASALADGEFTVLARPLRTNRSTQHWYIELSQNGEVAASGTAAFALRRETWSALEDAAPIGLSDAHALTRSHPVPHLAWTQRYDMRFVRGGLPLVFDEQEQSDSISEVWLRDEPSRPLDFASLASLCDSFFPRVILRRKKIVPIGTVSMTTYFHADAVALAEQDERHVFAKVSANNFRNGYFDQSAAVYSDRGSMLATSHQIVYYRD